MMNKARIVGLIMIVIAVVMHFTFENDSTDFFVGFFGGGGFGILFAGNLARKQKIN